MRSSTSDIVIHLNPTTKKNIEKKQTTNWKEEFTQLGCNKKIIENIIADNLIQNYKTIVESVKHINPHHRALLSTWELLCMSGEINALIYTKKEYNPTETLRGLYHATALHWATWSGSAAAVNYAIEVLKIPLNSVDQNHKNALHYAANRGSVETITYLRQLDLQPEEFDNTNVNAFDWADKSDNAFAARMALSEPTTQENKTIQPSSKSWKIEEHKYYLSITKNPIFTNEELYITLGNLRVTLHTNHPDADAFVDPKSQSIIVNKLEKPVLEKIFSIS